MIEFIKQIFIYNENAPLIFTRLYFWVFFLFVLTVYSLIFNRRIIRHAFLCAVSIFFYYKTSGAYVGLLMFVTVFDYFAAHLINNLPQTAKSKRAILLALSMIVNLGILSYYKYTGFYIQTFNSIFGTNYEVVDLFAKWMNEFTSSHFDIDKIFLPVGISFFTFQSMSYTIDVYRRRLKPVNNIVDFAFFVSFFPQLVAGPIVRASEFLPQLSEPYHLSKRDFGFAIFWILNGLLKKMFISDYIAVNFVDRVFETPLSYTGFENLMALYGYSLQVYADFSGYTDIAIGVAMLLGYRLPINFNSPYKAVHVGEFWKRWHISLSTWLKDYLYIPLGGNRNMSFFSYFIIIFILLTATFSKGFNYINAAFILALAVCWWMATFKKYKVFNYFGIALIAAFLVTQYDNNWSAFVIFGLTLVFWVATLVSPDMKKSLGTDVNLMLTMLLGGLWHGASWQFVIWGGLNGMGLVIYKFWRKVSPFDDDNRWYSRFWGILLTFNFITFTRIWFRSPTMDTANEIMSQIAQNFAFTLVPKILVAHKAVFILILLGFIIHWLSVSSEGNHCYFSCFTYLSRTFSRVATIYLFPVLVP